jgi:hypothetical protein
MAVFWGIASVFKRGSAQQNTATIPTATIVFKGLLLFIEFYPRITFPQFMPIATIKR